MSLNIAHATSTFETQSCTPQRSHWLRQRQCRKILSILQLSLFSCARKSHDRYERVVGGSLQMLAEIISVFDDDDALIADCSDILAPTAAFAFAKNDSK